MHHYIIKIIIKCTRAYALGLRWGEEGQKGGVRVGHPYTIRHKVNPGENQF